MSHWVVRGRDGREYRSEPCEPVYREIDGVEVDTETWIAGLVEGALGLSLIALHDAAKRGCVNARLVLEVVEIEPLKPETYSALVAWAARNPELRL